ncbi:MAG: ABC transporter substrate-binding protein, partial [Candidatus Bathyarchaeia archaeon]
EQYPTVDTLRIGILGLFGGDPIYNAPNEILESVFGHLMYINPYKTNIPSKSPNGGDQPWLAKDWMYWVDGFNRSHVVFWIERSMRWHDGAPFTALDVDYTIRLIKSNPSSWYYPYVEHVEDTIVYDDYTIEVIFDNPSIWNIYNIGLWIYIVPMHLPGVNTIGASAWKYSIATPIDAVYLEANRDFPLNPNPADMDIAYYWNPGEPPCGGCYKIGLVDLVMIAKAYGSRGNPPSPNWEPTCDIASPSCIIGLVDLVVFARAYGQTWGHYDP